MLLSGVLSRAARVSRVNPLFNLNRQIYSFSLVENSLFGPVLAFRCRAIFTGPVIDGLERTNVVEEIMQNLELQRCEASEVL